MDSPPPCASPSETRFAYHQAFERNLGWVTEWEQLALRAKTVAIAGMGGVGGIHLLTLTRLGVGGFAISDLDRFEQVNFNRQSGATMRTLGQPKVEVMARMAREINPELRLRLFPDGVRPENVDAFLAGADLYVDGFDFFELAIRRRVFARCRELGIPAITAGPIGMGTGFIIFTPDGMSFEDYFRFAGHPEPEQFLRFLLGLAPRGLHQAYFVDDSRVDLAGRRGPSTAAACDLCAGVVAAEAVRLLLRRGGVRAAPYHHHYDAYRGKLAVSKLRWGNDGPLQRLKLAIGRRLFAARSQMTAKAPPAPPALRPIEEILNLARWAPSGDNVQPWRFEILGEMQLRVVLPEQTDIYQYRSAEPTWLAVGALVESLRIAASGWQCGMRWTWEERRERSLLVSFAPDDAPPDPLLPHLSTRSVDRRRYRLTPLTAPMKAALAAALGPELRLAWHESLAERWRFAQLGGLGTDIRLQAPEAYPVHREVIDWTNRYSEAGIPARAIGLDRLTLALMRWGMRRWRRIAWLNRLGATWWAAWQMDYRPALSCAAFFRLLWADGGDGAREPGDVVAAGQSLQRFWLTADKLGLAMHPATATLCFAGYGEAATDFTQVAALRDKARKLAAAWRKNFGGPAASCVFAGRIGVPLPRPVGYRSVRRQLAQLKIDPADEARPLI